MSRAEVAVPRFPLALQLLDPRALHHKTHSFPRDVCIGSIVGHGLAVCWLAGLFGCVVVFGCGFKFPF